MSKTQLNEKFHLVPDPPALTSYASRDDISLDAAPLWYLIVGSVMFIISVPLLVATYFYDMHPAFPYIAWFFIFCAVANFEGAHRLNGPRSRHRRLMARYGSLPWTRDYPWDPDGYTVAGPRITLITAIAGLFWLVMCNIPLILLLRGVTGLSTDTAFKFIMVPLSFLTSLFFIYFLTIRPVARYLRHGSSRLLFDHAPFLTGSTLKASLKPSRALGHFDTFTLTLRCIQPTYMSDEGGRIQKVISANTSDSDDDRRTRFRQVFIAQLAAHDITLDASPLPFQFNIPADAPPSLLSQRVADYSDDDQLNNVPLPDGLRYWELVAHGKRPGVDYHASFLVPVYAPNQTLSAYSIVIDI